MKETLHKHRNASEVEASESLLGQNEVKAEKISSFALLKNWPLMSTIIVYCVFSLQEIAYTEVNKNTSFILLLHCQKSQYPQILN